MKSPTLYIGNSNFDFRYDIGIHYKHSAASDLGLHCLPITLLGISRLQCVKYKFGNLEIREFE